MHESLQQLSEALGSESSLVVEDELLVQRMLASVLKPFGDRVHFAHDGVHGLEQFAARPFAVALCDLHMPAMNGIDLCAAVLRDYPESALL
ncbi:MAG: response regulator, partial [Planctomycetota bacterium]